MRRFLAVLTALIPSLHPAEAAAQQRPVPAAIPAPEYAARRDSLLARLGDGAAVIAFGERAPIGFPAFYQVPTFRYLTGFLEPEAALILSRRGGATSAILFREPRSVRDVIWDGPPEDSAALGARTGLVLRPLAALPAAERFHWLTAPRSTIIQVSPAHTGITADPEARLEELMRTYVL
jgi:hypothetical protein